MRDDDDCFSLLTHRAKNTEELLDFLRREHGCGLIKNQDARATIERFEYLDSLLLADRQIFHFSRRIDREPKVVREPANLLFSFREIDPGRTSGLGPKDDVLEHGHRGNEHEMLMHHSESDRDRVVRRADI